MPGVCVCVTEPSTVLRVTGCHMIQQHFLLSLSSFPPSVIPHPCSGSPSARLCLLWPFGTFNFLSSLTKAAAVAKRRSYSVSVPHKLAKGCCREGVTKQ